MLHRVERLLAAGPAARPWWTFAAAVVLLTGGATLVLATPAAAPAAASALVWTGTLRPGERLRARNIAGPIRVVRATGTTAVIRANVAGAPPDLSFQATRQDDGVTLCVLRAAFGRCDAEGYTWFGPLGEMSRARIELIVELPAGVSVTVATFDGDLQLDAMDADVEARTGSGAIAASILETPGNRTLGLHTGDGAVTVVLPTAFGGELEARLSKGRIAAGPPVGPFESGSHRVRRSLGPGGNRLSISSGNGDLALTRR